MKTDSLIAALARDTQPVTPISALRGLMAGAVVTAVIAAGGILFLYGVRPNWEAASTAIALKSAYWLVAALASAPVALRLMRPSLAVREVVWGMAGFAGFSVLAALLALALAPQEERLSLWFQHEIPECLWRVPLLASPAFAVFAAITRRSAPTRLAMAGAALGVFSGAVSGLAYAWYCAADTIPYVCSWYLTALLICGALGALAGRWLLRW